MTLHKSPLKLRTRRPSPTTVLYTVTAAPSHEKLTTKLTSLLVSLIRAALFGLSTLYLYAAIRLLLATPLISSPTIDLAQVDRIVATYTPAFRLASSFNHPGFVPVIVAVAWACSRRVYIEESLLLIRGLGIQTSSSSPYYWFNPTTRFIPTPQIQDVLIHEAFKGFEVRYYLAVVVEGEEEAVVVFPKLLPNRAILEEVWRGAKACLYEPAKVH